MKSISFLMLGLLFISCSENFSGERKLGNRFVLDGIDDDNSHIVFCLNSGVLGCYSSYSVVSESVANVAFNDRWIIAKSNSNEIEKYWLIDKEFEVDLDNCERINCDSIIKTKTHSYLDSISFFSKLKDENISLSFDGISRK